MADLDESYQTDLSAGASRTETPAVVQKRLGQGTTTSIAAFLGFMMIYFDSSIYNIAAPFVAPLFFPKTAYLTAVLLYLLTYPVGYLGRPIGGMIFGHYGDKRGRKRVWLYSIVGMGAATVLVGVLPTYAQAGYLSTSLLILLRLMQGIFLGGESTGSTVISLESVPDKLRGFFSGLVQSAFPFGLTLASVDLGLVAIFAPGAFCTRGFCIGTNAWRYLFLFGLIPFVIALIARLVVKESPEWEAKAKNKVKGMRSPVIETLRHHWKIVIPSLLIGFGGDLIAQDTAQYFPTFLRVFTSVSVATIALVGIVPNLIRGVLSPLFGYAGDLLRNRKNLMYFYAIATAVLVYPMFQLIKSGDTLTIILAVLVIQALFQVSLANGIFMSEVVPTTIRWSFNGIYQFGTTLASFGPFIVTAVGAATNNPYLTITGVVALGALFAIVGIFFMPKDRTGQPLY